MRLARSQDPRSAHKYQLHYYIPKINMQESKHKDSNCKVKGIAWYTVRIFIEYVCWIFQIANERIKNDLINGETSHSWIERQHSNYTNSHQYYKFN